MLVNFPAAWSIWAYWGMVIYPFIGLYIPIMLGFPEKG